MDENGNFKFNFYEDDITSTGDEGGLSNQLPLIEALKQESQEVPKNEEETRGIKLKTITTVFNHQNLWANLQILDPTVIFYSFLQESLIVSNINPCAENLL